MTLLTVSYFIALTEDDYAALCILQTHHSNFIYEENFFAPTDTDSSNTVSIISDYASELYFKYV